VQATQSETIGQADYRSRLTGLIGLICNSCPSGVQMEAREAFLIRILHGIHKARTFHSEMDDPTIVSAIMDYEWRTRGACKGCLGLSAPTQCRSLQFNLEAARAIAKPNQNFVLKWLRSLKN
jgi:hypothetical protein